RSSPAGRAKRHDRCPGRPPAPGPRPGPPAPAARIARSTRSTYRSSAWDASFVEVRCYHRQPPSTSNGRRGATETGGADVRLPVRRLGPSRLLGRRGPTLRGGVEAGEAVALDRRDLPVMEQGEDVAAEEAVAERVHVRAQNPDDDGEGGEVRIGEE